MSMSPRLLRPRQSGFDPRSISGLALWLDASDASSLYTTDAGAVTAVSSPMDIATPALWLDASDAASITESGGLVSQWNDKSGNNRHATASSTARPTTGTRTVGGRNALDFDGTANSMATGGSAFPTAATHTVFLVYQLDSASQSRTSVLLTAATIGHQEIRVAGFGSTAVQYVFNNNLGTTMASTAIGLGPIVFSAREATVSMRSAGAGVVSTTSGSAFAWSSGSMLIGSRTAGNYVDGLLCEVIIYPTTLTDSQTSSVEAYLAAKWGIAAVHSQATASNDPVGAWLDKSGNGRHATQATAGSRPLLLTSGISSKPALKFDGTDDNIWRQPGLTANDLSILIVHQQDSLSGGVTYDFCHQNDVTNAQAQNTTGFFNNLALQVTATGTPVQCMDCTRSFTSVDSQGRNGNAGDVSAGVPVISTACASFSPTAAAIRKQAWVSGKGAQGVLRFNAGQWSAMSLGCRRNSASTGGINTPSAFFNGRIAEVLAYSQYLTDLDRRRLELYLARKWSVTLTGAPAVSNADAQDWIDRVYANGASVSVSTAAAVNNFCDAIDNAGIRDRFFRLNLFSGTGLNACMTPLYVGPSSRGIKYGNATDTNVGPFVSGDYAETGASAGLTGNGTSKYLNTGLKADALPSADRHLSATIDASNIGSGSKYCIGADNFGGAGNFYWGILSGATAGSMMVRAHNAATNSSSFAVTGRPQITLSGNGSAPAYLNGSLAVTGISGAFTAPALDIYVLGLNRNGSTIDAYGGRVQSYSIGLGMTAAQAAAYYTAMQAFQTALSRA